MTDQTPVSYHIRPVQPGAHIFEVSCTVADPDPQGQRFSLPAWIPGSYMIRDFARNIVRVSAQANGDAVSLHKVDKQTWQCAPCQGPLTLTYEVYAWDLSVRSAHLDTSHGFFNGTSVFLCAEGRENSPCGVEIAAPEGANYAGWRVATALSRDGAKAYGFGRYRAENYDELVDHPVEMGTFSLATFDAGGVPHDIVITGRHRADMARLCRDLKTVCEQHIGLFGALPPMQRYVFLVMAVGEGYGGLEHRASTALMCSRDDLPIIGDSKMSEGYRGFLGLCSHEYFHTWNIKRIKPAVFAPYDLSKESYTRQLWAFEGITSYYDDLGLARGRLISDDAYLELLGQTATRVWRFSGRLKQTVTDSSLDAWSKFYKQDENSPNAIVSYYTKGALVALALDLTIRRETDGAKSLDDVMRALWREHGQSGIGVPEGGIERLAQEVTGVDLKALFAQALYSTEELPLGELLADFGVKFDLRAAESAADKGGKPATKRPEDVAAQGYLGVRTAANGEVKITQVLDGGAAQEAGLSAGDVVVALDGLRVTGGNFEKRLISYRPGTKLSLHAFRRDELMTFDVTLKAPPLDTCVFSLADEVDTSTRARREAWLKGV